MIVKSGNHQCDMLVTVFDYNTGEDVCEAKMMIDSGGNETLDTTEAVAIIPDGRS